MIFERIHKGYILWGGPFQMMMACFDMLSHVPAFAEMISFTLTCQISYIQATVCRNYILFLESELVKHPAS